MCDLGFLGRLLRGCLRVGEELDRPHNALEVLFLDHEPGILRKHTHSRRAYIQVSEIADNRMMRLRSSVILTGVKNQTWIKAKASSWLSLLPSSTYPATYTILGNTDL